MPMFEQRYTFTFEAAHELAANVADRPGHIYSRVHGHSFEVTVILRVAAVGEDGWVTDFADVKAACGEVHDALDHRLLNEIEGLERPTLERMAEFIFAMLRPALPAVSAVEVARPTLREVVRYEA